MIRQAAFTPGKPLLKGGLHSHSTRSDGELAPDALIRLHARKGYDFLALTDHRVYNYANYAPDARLLVLPGIETDGNGVGPAQGTCFHTVAVGPLPQDGNAFEQDEKVESVTFQSAEDYQPMVDMLLRKGNLVIYAHPQWSGTPARTFERLQGVTAMEVWNSGCALENDMDYDNGFIWDELLRRGMRIFGVAVDDGHLENQHGHGWVCVRAHQNPASIVEALRQGAFYSTCGPVIDDFYVADGKAVVVCSAARYVLFASSQTPWWHKVTAPSGPLTYAEYPLNPGCRYVRAVVMDERGRRAWSNPIFL